MRSERFGAQNVAIRPQQLFNMKLYYHKTDGGAEYLSDAFIECKDGHKEGAFADAKYIVRIDGDITKDAELSVRENKLNIAEKALIVDLIIAAAENTDNVVSLGMYKELIEKVKALN